MAFPFGSVGGPKDDAPGGSCEAGGMVDMFSASADEGGNTKAMFVYVLVLASGLWQSYVCHDQVQA